MSSLRKLGAVILVAILGMVLCPGLGFGAEAEAVPEKPAVSPAEAEAPVAEPTAPLEETVGPEAEAGPTVAITPTGLISFDFREAAIRDVLRLFARQVNINIVMTPSVQGAVSMKLDNVKWRKALETILEVNKLKMTEDKENNIIKVMTEAEVAAEPMTTKIYSLKYLQAADYDVESVEYDQAGKKVKTTKKMDGAAKMLEPLIAENEKIKADAAGNKLIVHAIPATHDKLQTAIEGLDKQTMQVLIEVKFIEASTDAEKNLGVNWDFMNDYKVFEGQVTPSWSSDRTTTRDETVTGTQAGGRYWRNRDGVSLYDRTRDLTGSMDWVKTDANAYTKAQSFLKTATLTPDKVTLMVSALFTDTDTKLISNPRISTVDNKQAIIRAVKEFPIPKWTYNSDTGGWEVQGFDYKDIGITLKVTPHINQDNFVTLDVDPEVSNMAGTTTFGGGAGGTAEIPIVDSRNATTRVVVKSGETLVIGGLVKSDEVTTKTGVPLLKDIPVLGNLFKHSLKTQVKSDLLIFLTPTIVEGPAASILAPPAEK